MPVVGTSATFALLLPVTTHMLVKLAIAWKLHGTLAPVGFWRRVFPVPTRSAVLATTRPLWVNVFLLGFLVAILSGLVAVFTTTVAVSPPVIMLPVTVSVMPALVSVPVTVPLTVMLPVATFTRPVGPVPIVSIAVAVITATTSSFLLVFPSLSVVVATLVSSRGIVEGVFLDHRATARLGKEFSWRITGRLGGSQLVFLWVTVMGRLLILIKLSIR